MRITEEFIKKQVKRLNLIINKQKKSEKPFTSGYFDLDYAYGGMQLIRYTNTSGACEDMFRTGHIKKKALSDLIYAFEIGLTLKKG